MIILQWQQSLHYCMTGLKMHSCRSSSPCTISHNPFIILSGWANYIRTQLGQVALDHCSHFGWDLHAFTAYTHLPWNQHWDRKEWKMPSPQKSDHGLLFPANAVVHFPPPTTGGDVGWCSCPLHGCLILPLLLTADYWGWGEEEAVGLPDGVCGPAQYLLWAERAGQQCHERHYQHTSGGYCHFNPAI